MVKIRNKAQKGRFAITGAIATSIDFIILFGLSALGMPSVAANFVSTTVAFCFSFLANRHYTFQASEHNVTRQIILFVIVTLFGIWVLQPPIILTVEHFVENNFSFRGWIVLAIGKFAATGVTLLWNYFLYSRVVFKAPRSAEIIKE